MPLGKRELLRLIKERKQSLEESSCLTQEEWTDKEKEFLQDKTEEYKNGSYLAYCCARDTGKYRTECELNLLNEILTTYYQPKKRTPTKLEFMEACLEYVEKRIPLFKSEKRHRYKTTWKYFLVNELKEKIEKLRKLKKIRTELKEVSIIK